MKKKKQHLLSGDGDLEGAPGQFIADIEPIFYVPESSDLSFSSICPLSLANYLRHCITRDPRHLLSHVRRILLMLGHGRRVDVFAALLDLFIVLGKRGLGLRARMLELSRARLKTNQYEWLRDSLAAGVDETKTPIVPGSLLSRGIEGKFNLIRQEAEESVDPRDPLLEAQEYLEYSQIDEARCVLENAVLEAPARTGLHYELLEIYRLTRDQENFAKMLQRIGEMNNPVPEEWEETAEFFRRSHG